MDFNKIENKKYQLYLFLNNNYAINTAVAITSLKHNRNVNIQYEVFL